MLGAQTKGQSEDWPNCLIPLVGAAGFELATPCTPCKCATRLRYAPKLRIIDMSSVQHQPRAATDRTTTVDQRPFSS